MRYQPERALRGWFRERFGGGGKRVRRIGMVAVARKLLIALWRFLEKGSCPRGQHAKKRKRYCGAESGLRPWYWWRRPIKFPGLASTPS